MRSLSDEPYGFILYTSYIVSMTNTKMLASHEIVAEIKILQINYLCLKFNLLRVREHQTSTIDDADDG